MTQTASLPLTVINARNGTMYVHATGCADLTRQQRGGENGRFDFTAATRDAALTEIWGDFLADGSMDLDDADDQTHFYPCAADKLASA